MSKTSSHPKEPELEDELDDDEPDLITHTQVMGYLLSCIQLDDATIAYISNADLRNVVDRTVFTTADCSALKSLKQWLAQYRSKHIELPNGNEWRAVFNEDIFINYLVAGLTTSASPITLPIHQVSTNLNVSPPTQHSFRGRLGDFPECTGRSRDWYNFKAKFEGTAGGQDCYEVLQKYSPGDPILQDPQFIQKSKFIFAVLKRSSAYGIVKDTILQHEEHQDGNRTWINLVNDMETQGNPGQLVAENTNNLAKVKLSYDSRGGFSVYK
jgi:hypothetical protein